MLQAELKMVFSFWNLSWKPLLNSGFSLEILHSFGNTDSFTDRFVILANGEVNKSVAPFRNFMGLRSIPVALFLFK